MYLYQWIGFIRSALICTLARIFVIDETSACIYCYQIEFTISINSVIVVRCVRKRTTKNRTLFFFLAQRALFLKFTLFREILFRLFFSFDTFLFVFEETIYAFFFKLSVVKDDCRSKTTSKLVKMTRNEWLE